MGIDQRWQEKHSRIHQNQIIKRTGTKMYRSIRGKWYIQRGKETQKLLIRHCVLWSEYWCLFPQLHALEPNAKVRVTRGEAFLEVTLVILLWMWSLTLQRGQRELCWLFGHERTQQNGAILEAESKLFQTSISWWLGFGSTRLQKYEYTFLLSVNYPVYGILL